MAIATIILLVYISSVAFYYCIGIQPVKRSYKYANLVSLCLVNIFSAELIIRHV